MDGESETHSFGPQNDHGSENDILSFSGNDFSQLSDDNIDNN